MSPAVSGLAELSIECKPDVVLAVADSNQITFFILAGPIAVADGGDQSGPYMFQPDASSGLSLVGEAGTANTITYTVTDVAGDTAQCTIVMSIVLQVGESAWVRGVLPRLGSGVCVKHALQ